MRGEEQKKRAEKQAFLHLGTWIVMNEEFLLISVALYGHAAAVFAERRA